MENSQLLDIEWDFEDLVTSLSNGKCILIMGPELPVSNTNECLHLVLKKYLEEKHIFDLVHFGQDGFFSFRDEDEKQRTYFRIIDFFEKIAPPDIYSKIAEIPFKIVVSLSPDQMLKKVMDKIQKPYDFQFYHKDENPKPIKNSPSPSKPLIYNLLGSIEDEDSLVFTYDDMFDYIINISGEYEIPDLLKSELQKTKNYIFLGFSFEKWYLKLLLRIMKLHHKKVIKTNGKELEDKLQQEGFHIEPNIKVFYKKLFKIDFIENYNVENFVQKLHDKCKERGVLFKGQGDAASGGFKKETQRLIGRNEIKEAIRRVGAFLKENKLEEKVIHLTEIARKFKAAEDDFNMFLITKEEKSALDSRVSQALLKMIEVVS